MKVAFLASLFVISGVSDNALDATMTSSSLAVDDCYVQRLDPDSSGSGSPPTVDDSGTTSGTNSAGCDGCVINWQIVVTWNHNGPAQVTGPHAATFSNVTSGSTYAPSGSDSKNIPCSAQGTSSSMSICTAVNTATGGWGAQGYVCTDCR